VEELPPIVETLTEEEIRWLAFVAKTGISVLTELVLLLSERETEPRRPRWTR